MITDQQKVDLQMLWLNGWPVYSAATQLGIRHSIARRLIDKTKRQLTRDGKPWPRALGPTERPLATLVLPKRTASPRPATPPAPQCPPAQLPPPQSAAPAPSPPEPSPISRRRPTFEEQLARIAAGARLTRTFRPPSADHPFTLGGIGSSLL
ncbi:hypothetical protein IWY39_002601 [Sphingobium sp. JAI105]|uniref:hypothetical protein n=1 Tax=Sphingobium sp. JAI105 TaxID=2787715 RepID=UPI0018CA7E3A|nr:hypothetical protein [Sphingobium sp. JAI105]MBG6118797.1 hypothetical protein [Sphingobium sp. JAI105]